VASCGRFSMYQAGEFAFGAPLRVAANAGWCQLLAAGFMIQINAPRFRPWNQ
jgi:hypothetical protein